MNQLEGRIANLEKDLAEVKTDLAVIRSNYASKSDAEQLKAEFRKWMLGTVIGLFSGLTSLFFALTNTLKPVPAPPAKTAPPATALR